MTKAGAAKIAARQIGVSVEEYEQRRADGEKWCSAHRAFHPQTHFSPGAGSCREEKRHELRERYSHLGKPLPRLTVGRPRTCHVAKVKRLLAQGIARSEIARMCGCSYWAVARVANRSEEQDEREVERLRQLLIRRQQHEMAVRLQHQRLAQRESDARDKDTSLNHMLSLDTPLRAGGPEGWDMGEGLHAFKRSHDPRIGEDTAFIVERAAHNAVLYGIAGDIGPEDVLRMNESELDAIRRKLLEAGIAPGGVQDSERKRLRMPIAHSGRTVAKAPLLSGRKTRRQKIAHKAANANKGNSNRPKQKPRKRWTRA